MSLHNRYIEQYNQLNEPDLGELDSRLLEYYLEGRLNTAERTWFTQIILDKLFSSEWNAEQTAKLEKLLATDPVFRIDFHNYREATHFIKDREANEFRQKVRKELGRRNSNKRWIYYSAAALIILLLSIAYLLFQGDRSDANQKLYAAYYEPYDIKLRNVRTGQNSENLNDMYSIPDTKIDSVITVFQEFIRDDPDNYLARMNLAGLLMEKQEFSGAATLYERIITNNKTKYFEEALWYLALCYLHDNDSQQSIALLKRIADLNGKLSEQANSFIKEIETAN